MGSIAENTRDKSLPSGVYIPVGEAGNKLVKQVQYIVCAMEKTNQIGKKDLICQGKDGKISERMVDKNLIGKDFFG